MKTHAAYLTIHTKKLKEIIPITNSRICQITFLLPWLHHQCEHDALSCSAGVSGWSNRSGLHRKCRVRSPL
jgi:hypothetical protein